MSQDQEGLSYLHLRQLDKFEKSNNNFSQQMHMNM